jgi:hypothetical protein
MLDATGASQAVHVRDILEKAPLPEMLYSRKKAEALITGLEEPINEHSLKLLVVSGDQDRAHWTKELLEWLDDVAEIRLKPDDKTAPASFYDRILFDEPFGGTDTDNIARRLRRLERQGYELRDADLDGVLQRLRRFHERFSEACRPGAEVEEINRLLAEVSS